MLIIATCFYKDNCGKVKIFTHCSKTTDTSELIDTVYFRCLTENGTVSQKAGPLHFITRFSSTWTTGEGWTYNRFPFPKTVLVQATTSAQF